MSPASMQLFPPIVRQHFFTDHSVATILAPEKHPLPASSLSPPSDEQRQHDDPMTDTAEPPYPVFNRPAPLRFTGCDRESVTGRAVDSAHHQIGSSFSVSVSPYVDLMMLACPSGSELINHFDQPLQKDRKNFEEAMVLQNAEFQTAGFGTSASSTPKDGVQADDGGQWTATQRGGVLRPMPTFPRASPSLPSNALTDSPQLELEAENLWRRFDELTTEMVITKSGRSVSKRVHTHIFDLRCFESLKCFPQIFRHRPQSRM